MNICLHQDVKGVAVTETPAIYQAGIPVKHWRCEHCNHVLGEVYLVNGREQMTLVDKLQATVKARIVAFTCPNCQQANVWVRDNRY